MNLEVVNDPYSIYYKYGSPNEDSEVIADDEGVDNTSMTSCLWWTSSSGKLKSRDLSFFQFFVYNFGDKMSDKF